MSQTSQIGNITTKNNQILIQPLMVKAPKNIQKRVFCVSKRNPSAFNKGSKAAFLNKKLEVKNAYTFREDLIYESVPGDFLQGNPQIKMTLLNHLNLKNNSSLTKARYTDVTTGALLYEKTSVRITKVLGQHNYDVLFSSLCSVINLESKVRGMLTLLSQMPGKEDVSCATERKDLEDKYCQTNDSCMELLFKPAQRKRVKRNQLTPYVVMDLPQKTVKEQSIDDSIEDVVCSKRDIKSPCEPQIKSKGQLKKLVINPIKPQIIEDAVHGIKYEIIDYVEKQPLPELKQCFSEDSNEGSIGNVSISSFPSIPNILENTNELLKEIDQHMEEDILMPLPVKTLQTPTYITMLDGTQIKVPIKPEDHFHIATKEILANVTDEEKAKLLWYQAYIDYKCSLEKDEFGYLPLHTAVLNNDIQLLKRQCVMLRYHREQRSGVSLDITTDCNKTALQLSFYENAAECTSTLLQYGADPFFTDDEQRTLLHLAAEHPGGHLAAILNFLKNNARQVLVEQEDLWKPDMEAMSEEQLAKWLLEHMCRTIDTQGYTPLMVASKTGLAENVKLLIDAAPSTIDVSMPNSGNTALYLAVGAACMDTANRCNKSKIAPNFNEIIKLLINHGADPLVTNHWNSSINELLSEFNITELSHVVNLAVHTSKHGPLDGTKSYDSYMLLTDKDGGSKLTDIKVKTEPSKSNFVTKTVADNVITKTKVKSDSQAETGDKQTTDEDGSSKRTDIKVKSEHSKRKFVRKNVAGYVLTKTKVKSDSQAETGDTQMTDKSGRSKRTDIKTEHSESKFIGKNNAANKVITKTEVVNQGNSQAEISVFKPISNKDGSTKLTDVETKFDHSKTKFVTKTDVKPKLNANSIANVKIEVDSPSKPKEKPIILENVTVVTHDMTLGLPKPIMTNPVFRMVSPKDKLMKNIVIVNPMAMNSRVIMNKSVRITPKIENDTDNSVDVSVIESTSNINKKVEKRKVPTVSIKAKKSKGFIEVESSHSDIVSTTVKLEPI